MTGRNLQLLICKPAVARDDFADPSLTGWTFESGMNPECDGDILTIEGTDISEAIDAKKTISLIDCSVYKYAIVRFRIVSVSGSAWMTMRGSGGGDKILCTYADEVGKWYIRVLDASGFGSSNSLIWLYFWSEPTGGSMKIQIDFALFTNVNPFYTDNDLEDVFDIPQWKNGLNNQADFLQLIVDNFGGQHKTRFAYRDEAYLWVKKDTDFKRLFGGYIESIDPESVQYGKEYLTLNCLGWSALLHERLVAATYENEDVDDVAKDIIDLANKQAALELTTFGVKDVQKQVPVLKCDYDPALTKLTEMCEQLDLAVHVEPNLDVSLYPAGKRFLRYAGWMEDSWLKGWACTAKEFTSDGDIAQIKTGSAGGSGTFYRVSTLSVDSIVFKKLLLELKGSDVDTKYTVKVVTADDTEYTVQPETAAPTDYTANEWDLTSIITGTNKTVKNIHLLISKTGSQGTLYFKWLGFFPATPPYEKITLDAAQNVKAGVFIREPKKARNMIIVKGDKHVYHVPLESDDWTKEPAPLLIYDDDESFWTAGGGAAVSENTTQKIMNASCLEITTTSAGWFYHDYGSEQDWTGKKFVFFYWKGANSGDTIEFTLYMADNQKYYRYNWVDNYTGWKLHRIAFEDMQKVNSPSKNIRYIYFESLAGGYTWYLDYFGLSLGFYCWASKFFTLSNDVDAKAGSYSLKAVKQSGVASNFLRKSSGFILQDNFNSLDLNKYDKGAYGSGDGDSYVSSGELVNKVEAYSGDYYRWIITEDAKALAGKVIELKIMKGCSNRLLLSPSYTVSGNPLSRDYVAVRLYYEPESMGGGKNWLVQERDYPDSEVTHYSMGLDSGNPEYMVAKLILTLNNLKVYLDNELVCNVSRVTSFTDAYIFLAGNTSLTYYEYPKMDNLKIYAGTKVYVEGLSPSWKVELWSGTYSSPGSKQAEATVPVGSTVAELDVLTLVFPFTGFFKVFDNLGSEDHHSPDYNDIWGGDIYQAQQTVSIIERMVYFPLSKDLKANALALKRLKFWMKHDVAEETGRLILATDDENYYYIDFMPITKWKELFSFDVGFIQNIEFEEVGTPRLSEINYVGFLYPSSSQMEWCKIDELRFEGETETWGIARDQAKIAEYGFQPEKIVSSAYKTPEDAQLAAEYFLELLKTPTLVKGSVTHPWGLLPLYAGDSAIVNVPNQNIDNEELTVKEVVARLPHASTIFPMEINVAGLPSALTDPQKRLKAYIERLQKADVYAEKVEAFTDLKDGLSIVDTLSVIGVILRHFEVDALLVGRFSKAFQADAVLVGKSSKAFLADAFLVSRLSKTILIDAFLKGEKTKLMLVDALLKAYGKTKTFSVDAKVIERILWEEFANMNDWTSRLGTWGISSGWLEQTDDVIEYSVCDYTGSVDFPPDYFIEFVAMAYDAANDSISVWIRWDGQYSGNADCYDVAMDVNDDKVKIGKIVNGSYTEFASASKTIDANTAYKIKCEQRDEDSGVRFKVWFESESSPCINYLESTKTHSDGKIACFMYEATGKFDYVHVWEE